MGQVAAAVVEALHLSHGVEAARQFYTPVLKGPSPGGAFWRHVLSMEQAAVAGSSGQDTKQVRTLYEVQHECNTGLKGYFTGFMQRRDSVCYGGLLPEAASSSGAVQSR